jgi:two-component system chemotaxis response regulator CheY
MEHNLKILIVDDFATMRKILINFLNKLEFSAITQAESAQQAWDLLQKESFDLVISDYNMPDMTGLDLLTKVRTEYHNKKQKFIMLTAETDKDILINTKAMHVDAYILKPFKIDTLKEKINQVFGFS